MIRLWLLTCAALLATGCVRRTVTINTDPQGAMVTLNDQRIGSTPVSTDFTWYGDYDVIIEREGYETLRTHKKLLAPWYQIPGIDFFTETLLPFTLHDKQEMSFQLETTKTVARDELIKEAKEKRERTLFESGTAK